MSHLNAEKEACGWLEEIPHLAAANESHQGVTFWLKSAFILFCILVDFFDDLLLGMAGGYHGLQSIEVVCVCVCVCVWQSTRFN